MARMVPHGPPPDAASAEGLLDEIRRTSDGEPVLRAWAEEVDRNSGRAEGYRFSFSRTVGNVKVVVVDDGGTVMSHARRPLTTVTDGERVTHDPDALWRAVVAAAGPRATAAAPPRRAAPKDPPRSMGTRR